MEYMRVGPPDRAAQTTSSVAHSWGPSSSLTSLSPHIAEVRATLRSAVLPSLRQVERVLAMRLNCINRCLFRSLSAARLFSLVCSYFVKCTCRGGDEEEASEQPTLARKRERKPQTQAVKQTTDVHQKPELGWKIHLRSGPRHSDQTRGLFSHFNWSCQWVETEAQWEWAETFTRAVKSLKKNNPGLSLPRGGFLGCGRLSGDP